VRYQDGGRKRWLRKKKAAVEFMTGGGGKRKAEKRKGNWREKAQISHTEHLGSKGERNKCESLNNERMEENRKGGERRRKSCHHRRGRNKWYSKLSTSECIGLYGNMYNPWGIKNDREEKGKREEEVWIQRRMSYYCEPSTGKGARKECPSNRPAKEKSPGVGAKWVICGTGKGKDWRKELGV